jgi:hypothetical protein
MWNEWPLLFPIQKLFACEFGFLISVSSKYFYVDPNIRAGQSTETNTQKNLITEQCKVEFLLKIQNLNKHFINLCVSIARFGQSADFLIGYGTPSLKRNVFYF